MFSRSSWLHLRIPFSYFLLPIYLFSLSVSPNLHGGRLAWVFIILHFFLYPASNGYNSYFDKDEKSIGGLKNPPPVDKGLYFLSILFDIIAIVLGYIFLNATFAVMLFIYGAVSKAYSHPAVRIKKYAISGWIITGLFQGLFTFCMCYVGVNDFSFVNLGQSSVAIPGLLTSVMLWANYPMTQVYQHEEDNKRGDRTFSIMLGIRGTFIFAALFFSIAAIGFSLYFTNAFGLKYAIIFLVALSPVLVYFSIWFLQVIKNETHANYIKTMWLNFISATCLNGFFIYLFLDSSHVIQALQGGY